MLKKIVPALLALSAGMAVTPSQASDFLWSDTYLSYRYLWQDKQPGTFKDVHENAVNLSHADGWAYGSNFFSLDVEQFTRQDATNVAGNFDMNGESKSTGSGEFYGLFRSTFSGNKIFNTKAFSFGPLSDIGLQIGADWCTQNDTFASNKKMIVLGPEFSFDLPNHGFFNVAIHMAHEWNTNSYHSEGRADNFDAVPEFETSWAAPFNLGPVPLNFTGYANVIGPKGHGTSDDVGHGTEVLAHPKLMVDAGALLGLAPHKIDTGVGYEYWLHKFGSISTASVPMPIQRAVFFEVGYHFN